MKVVLDTNVLVSGIFWGGLPEKVLQKAIEDKIDVYATEEILSEYFRIIDKIGKKDKELCSQWKMLLVQLVKIVEPIKKIKICRDPKEDMFLECAISCGAKYLISGDDDLLSIKEINKTQIITTKEYLNLVANYRWP
jgi:putative PIN family toxin of toxin-antitoxin system